jgi:hypothetical protein
MVKHYKEPGAFYLHIKENVDKRIVTNFSVRLAKISACGRHVFHGVVGRMDHDVSSQLEIEFAPG